MTLELDGPATGRNPVEVGSIPTGVFGAPPSAVRGASRDRCHPHRPPIWNVKEDCSELFRRPCVYRIPKATTLGWEINVDRLRL